MRSDRLTFWLALGAFVFNLAAVGIVWVAGEQARQENCEKVSDAGDVIVDALISAGGELTAEQQARADAFRAEVHGALADCS